MYTVAKKLFLLAYVNKLSFKNGWLALKDVLSTVLPVEERGEDAGVWPTSAPSPASPTHSVEWDCSLHWPRCHWIAPVSVNRAGVITDLAGYAPRSGPSSTGGSLYTDKIYIIILDNLCNYIG